jgi:peptide/nickel transport system substrate-binding protein
MRSTARYIPGAASGRSRGSLPILICLLLLIAGCDAGPENSFPRITPNIISGPVRGGTLTVPIPEDTGPLHPLTERSRELCSLAGLIFEPLIRFDASGEPDSCLAQSWQVDESRLTWTFSLREGVPWHGLGRDMTARDVVFTMSLIEEMGPETTYSEMLDYVESWTAVDDYTLAVTMKYPFYGVINALDFPVVPEGCGYAKDTAPKLAIGTGPYRMISNDAAAGMALKVNEAWWRRLPYIEEIRAVPFSGKSEALAALVLQQLDVLQEDSLTATQYRDSGDANVYEYATRYFEFLAPNFNSLYLKDQRVRQAIAYALNRQEIASNVYVNHAIVVDTPIPPTSWLYQGRLVVYNQDFAEAERLLRLAGWKNTDEDKWLDISPEGVEDELSLVLLTYDEPDRSLRYDAARLIQTQLANVGIKIIIRSESWDVFLQMMQEGNYDLLLAGWYLSDIPDLRFAFASDSEGNVSGYASEQMDNLLAQALEQDTADGLRQVVGEIDQLIIADLPIISLYFRTHTLLTTLPVQAVRDISEDDAYGGIADWYIDPGLLS